MLPENKQKRILPAKDILTGHKLMTPTMQLCLLLARWLVKEAHDFTCSLVELVTNKFCSIWCAHIHIAHTHTHFLSLICSVWIILYLSQILILVRYSLDKTSESGSGCSKFFCWNGFPILREKRFRHEELCILVALESLLFEIMNPI